MHSSQGADDAVVSLMERHGREIARMLFATITAACASESRPMREADLILGIRPLLGAARVLAVQAHPGDADGAGVMLAQLLRSFADQIDPQADRKAN